MKRINMNAHNHFWGDYLSLWQQNYTTQTRTESDLLVRDPDDINSVDTVVLILTVYKQTNTFW